MVQQVLHTGRFADRGLAQADLLGTMKNPKKQQFTSGTKRAGLGPVAFLIAVRISSLVRPVSG